MADKKQLSEFARRAAQSLKDKKVRKKFTLHVPSMGTDMEFRDLSDDEIMEYLNMKDDDDPNRSDKHAVYLASVKPSLREIATELKEAGEIQQYMEIMDAFPLREIRGIAKQIMEKSGVLGGDDVKLVEQAVETAKN